MNKKVEMFRDEHREMEAYYVLRHTDSGLWVDDFSITLGEVSLKENWLHELSYMISNTDIKRVLDDKFLLKHELNFDVEVFKIEISKVKKEKKNDQNN